ncbi:deoxyribose-phosphate aldolase [Streptomyces sp. NPDC005708]|uniref:Cgl0159 family (beta/alpha)8-fold protein n=1 Tax=unclassified Streptomyces TaxID=2593676 RepID=UPI0033CF43B9
MTAGRGGDARPDGAGTAYRTGPAVVRARVENQEAAAARVEDEENATASLAQRRAPIARVAHEQTPAARVDIADLVRLRAHRPEAIAEAAARRARRPLIDDAGRLMIVAADHPARGALGVGDRRMAMASRADLLERLCLALSRPGVDGVLGTADILDDLLLLGALDGKVVMGSMNRGGLQGASFELDDRFTGHRPQDIERLGFDAGKLLLRIDYDDPGSLDTLESAARVINEMAERRLPVFVEPFISRRIAGGALRNDLSADAVTRSIAIASGLGGSSAYTWLKVPVTENPDDMARVMETSTLPAVLLGGDVGEDQEGAYEKWRGALQLPTVKGLVVGRSLLYPADGDVIAAVDTAVGLL